MILRRRLIWLIVYTVVMAYVESAVVVYLRALYYPRGFEFPLVLIEPHVAAIEIGREAATLVMLLAVSALAGADRWERFLAFCLSFGIWDLCYYAWLWVFLRWPPSPLTWDVLFLIPVPWVAPVLAPVLVSVALAGGALALLYLKTEGVRLRLAMPLWVLAVTGGAVVLASFTLDARVVLQQLEPPPFRWGLFIVGLTLGAVAFTLGTVGLIRSGPPRTQ